VDSGNFWCGVVSVTSVTSVTGVTGGGIDFGNRS
jgi:hypothetical protein